MPHLILVRGLPGCGKSTRAKELQRRAAEAGAPYHLEIVEADHFMVDGDGNYVFDPARLTEVHAKCLAKVAGLLAKGVSVVVANTFTTWAECLPYYALTVLLPTAVLRIESMGVNGMTLEELAERNVHGVPLEALRAMQARYEPGKIARFYNWLDAQEG